MEGKTPNPPHRPPRTPLTPELIERVRAAIQAGNYRQVAAHLAGVPTRTFNRWLAEGREGRGDLQVSLWQAVMDSEAAAENNAVTAILEAGRTDPLHLKWWLERKFPDRWGSQVFHVKQLRRDLEELRKLMGVTAPPEPTPDEPTVTESRD